MITDIDPVQCLAVEVGKRLSLPWLHAIWPVLLERATRHTHTEDDFCTVSKGGPACRGGGLVFFGHFSGEIFFLYFFMENGSIMPETDFKQKKILTFFF